MRESHSYSVRLGNLGDVLDEIDYGGRPENSIRYAAFREVCDTLEWAEYEKVTLNELVDVMEEELVETEFSAYSKRYMKEHLLEFYGNDVTMISETGKSDIFACTSNISSIVHSFYEQSKDVDVEFQKIDLIETAASIILNEIKEMILSWLKNYPTPDSLSQDNYVLFVTPLLRLFLS